MKDFKDVTVVEVSVSFNGELIPVGRLAEKEYRIYFEYHSDFIDRGLELSPFMLPLREGVHTFDRSLFEGLAGVFNDSLPDGWGRLLLDRYMRSQGKNPSDLTPLDRLAYVGMNGPGALVYQPASVPAFHSDFATLDSIAEETGIVLRGEPSDVLAQMLSLNASSGGARPKVTIQVAEDREYCLCSDRYMKGYDSWMVKFPNTHDGIDAGAIEYVYALMARESGIDVPQSHLFSSHSGLGYFGVKRFDRQGNRRLHMHSVSGLVHTDYRYPSLDYTDLLDLTAALTRDVREVEKMYRLAAFNVLAHNRDDHARNFSFLMSDDGEWKLSPAYDLTFAAGPGGEHSTMVAGEVRHISTEHLVRLGKHANLPELRIREILDQTRSALSQWSSLAPQWGVKPEMTHLISQKLGSLKR